VIVALFALAVGVSMGNDKQSYDAEGFVKGLKNSLTGAGRYKVSNVPPDTACFSNRMFRVQGTCAVVIPKKVRRIELQVLEGKPRATLVQNRDNRPGGGYEVLPSEVETEENALSVDLKGDGGTLTLICPVLCRMVIIE
jgi:hypothetical protein